LKTRRNTYFIIGTILIFFNLVGDLADLPYLLSQILKNDSFSIGYLIGSQFLLLVVIVLLRFAVKIHNKIKSQNDIELEKSIDEIGKSS